MGKARKAQPRNGNPKGGSKKMQNYSKLSTKMKKTQMKTQQQQRHNKPIIPFQPNDRILLVGEGDFSFALSLAKHHKCRKLMATCYDSEEKLYEKYPPVEARINQLCAANLSSSGGLKRKRDEHEGDKEKKEKSSSVHKDQEHQQQEQSSSKHRNTQVPFLQPQPPRVLFSIDARKLGALGGGGKVIRSGFPRTSPSVGPTRRQGKGVDTKSPNDGGPWDIICFNFPHVGGLSTDVNRQVRANQEVLVGFFKACVPLLSVPSPDAGSNQEDSYEEYDDDDNDDDEYPEFGTEDDSDDGLDLKAEDDRYNKGRAIRKEPGQIIVTLFEGEPYTLWNIRDLARHAGLRVVTSFKFPWASYPDYAHARTLGEVEGKDGSRGGWKGEEREARSYIFERKDLEDLGVKRGKKRRKGSIDDDSEEE